MAETKARNDPYSVLGVSRQASQDDIRQAYRRLAKRYHPDRNPGDKSAEDQFKRIQTAYDILGDGDKRARYDRGEIDGEGNELGGAQFYRDFGGGAGRQAGGTQGFGGFEDISDLFAEIFGGSPGGGQGGASGFGRSFSFDMGGSGFGGARDTGAFGGGTGAGAFGAGAFGGRGARGAGGDAVPYELTVDFLEAAQGARKRVTMPDGHSLDIRIPAGIADGQTLRLKGQGQPGPGGQAGDTYVRVRVGDHPHFERRGLDIYANVRVSLEEAVLGGKVPVETVHGQVNARVPPRTSSGKTLRLKGKGIRDAKTGQVGDHYARVQIVLPEEPDSELESLMRERASRRRATSKGS